VGVGGEQVKSWRNELKVQKQAQGKRRGGKAFVKLGGAGNIKKEEP